MKTQWILKEWQNDFGVIETDLYKIEFEYGDHKDKVMVITKNGKRFSFRKAEIELITEEKAMLWILENE